MSRETNGLAQETKKLNIFRKTYGPQAQSPLPVPPPSLSQSTSESGTSTHNIDETMSTLPDIWR